MKKFRSVTNYARHTYKVLNSFGIAFIHSYLGGVLLVQRLVGFRLFLIAQAFDPPLHKSIPRVDRHRPAMCKYTHTNRIAKFNRSKY